MPEHKDITGADLHIPGTHASSHATAGSDAITPASIGAATASDLALLNSEVSAHVATSGTDAHLIGNISGLADALDAKANINRIPTQSRTSIVRYFPLNGDINDYSGNNAHLSVAAGTLRWRWDQLLGRKVWNNPGDTYLTGSDTGLPSGNGVRTIMLRTNLFLSTKYLMGWGAPGTKTLCAMSCSNVGSFSAQNGSASLPSPNNVVMYRWCHLALTFNGSTVLIYLDGELVGASTWGTLSTSLAGAAGLVLGNLPVTGSSIVNGCISDVTIDNAVLSDATILEQAMLGGQ